MFVSQLKLKPFKSLQLTLSETFASSQPPSESELKQLTIKDGIVATAHYYPTCVTPNMIYRENQFADFMWGFELETFGSL
jgi:hypothetical protein